MCCVMSTCAASFPFTQNCSLPSDTDAHSLTHNTHSFVVYICVPVCSVFSMHSSSTHSRLSLHTFRSHTYRLPVQVTIPRALVSHLTRTLRSPSLTTSPEERHRITTKLDHHHHKNTYPIGFYSQKHCCSCNYSHFSSASAPSLE